MLRHFWALPAFLRLALCTQSSFSVHNDLLAFPQYKIIYSQSFISGDDAAFLLNKADTVQLQEHANDEEKPDITAELAVNLDRVEQEGQHSPVNFPSTNERDGHERLILNDRPYLCTIPYVPPPVPPNATASVTPEEQEAELARATTQALELLQDMQKNCIYYNGGWWWYSFCYNDGIRQFHPLSPSQNGIPPFPPVEDPKVHSFLLGRFPKQQEQEDKPPSPGYANQNSLDGGSTASDDKSSTTPAERTTSPIPESSLQTRGETHYLVQKLTGGTSCDLTGLDRRVEVQFHCNPMVFHDKIDMMKETSSCVYLMVIHTRKLCDNVAFRPPQQDKPHAITCQEIISTLEEEDDWHERKNTEAKQLMTQGAAEHTTGGATGPNVPSKKLIIGGIEVGAQRLVGSTPDLTISASKIVAALNGPLSNEHGSKKSKLIATLAESDGRYTKALEDKELAKLGLKKTKEAMNNLITQMQEQAGEGIPWRLEAWNVDGDLKFFGITETGKEDGSSGGNEGGGVSEVEGASGATVKGKGKVAETGKSTKEQGKEPDTVDGEQSGKKRASADKNEEVAAVAAPLEGGGEEEEGEMGSQEEFL